MTATKISLWHLQIFWPFLDSSLLTVVKFKLSKWQIMMSKFQSFKMTNSCQISILFVNLTVTKFKKLWSDMCQYVNHLKWQLLFQSWQISFCLSNWQLLYLKCFKVTCVKHLKWHLSICQTFKVTAIKFTKFMNKWFCKRLKGVNMSKWQVSNFS